MSTAERTGQRARRAKADAEPAEPDRRAPDGRVGDQGISEQVMLDVLEGLTSLRQGDFSVRLARHDGLAGQIAEQFNDLATLQERRHREFVRVNRVVGQEGRMTERVDDISEDGAWAVETQAVNSLIDELVRPTTEVARVIAAVAQGDLSQHMALEIAGQPLKGEFLRIGTTVNTMVDQLSSFADEVTRVAREVGTEGKLGGQAQVRGVSGVWRDLTENVNSMAGNLTSQVRNIAQVTTAVAQGDLSQKITVDARGEILELKSTVNTMVDQLSAFADEVTRVAREVGTEGKLGGQARVRGVSGTWRELTENVNQLAGNLTSQVRNIAQVTTAVAQGDLSQKITVDAQGEILELKSTVNTMVDQLSSFAGEVTRVAREVGTEGKLGGQAEVQGVSGTWRDLTQSVNILAGNLTTQVRAIAEVSTAVTRGDLTRSISVDTQGELAELKDNINQMIANLKETTEKNAQQDWLKSNLARISGQMQGQRDLRKVCQMIMSELTPVIEAHQGAFYLLASDERGDQLRLTSSYAAPSGRNELNFALGEGLVGQAAIEKRTIRAPKVPAGYLEIESGLGSAPPADVLVTPVLFEEQVLGVIELASFSSFSELHRSFLEQLVETIGVVLNTIIANARTEELLTQSQRLAQELQVQSVELQRTNAELEEKASLLSEQNRNIEIKNREIEMARLGLEEKAEQLAASSQYKSEFLANMSHELRTPLNSLLILARLLADNRDANLTPKQIEFAQTIHNAGWDLLSLINDILDLSKIEAGKMDVRPDSVVLDDVSAYVEQNFRPQVEEKGLELFVRRAPALPESIVTDGQRLQQVLKNLLSNAVKFTENGSVTLSIGLAPDDMLFAAPTLNRAEKVVAFEVSDTGIGIPNDKLKVIFDAFHQGDGTTSRKYGGTGLGLSISREIARLLGGSISVRSRPERPGAGNSGPGRGSTFTLYVPATYPFPSVEPDRGADATNEAEASRMPAILAGGSKRQIVAAAPTGNLSTLSGATVLVVDDDVRNVFALTSALELHGMTVLYADTGAAGIDLLIEHPEVDLVLMDVMMPDMDGNRTTTAIRQMPQFAALPIVFLTAKAMPEDRDKSIAAGATDYVTKPVDLDRLLDVMASWLGASHELPSTDHEGLPE
jgi:signal transduction histidine kinase/HAMP domain-containing protein/ActR/RegA family two-component response regulator